MHGVVRRTSIRAVSGANVQGNTQPPIGRANRSSTLRRAGATLSTDLPTTPPTALNTSCSGADFQVGIRAVGTPPTIVESSHHADDAAAAAGETAGIAPTAPNEEPCGLTPASLKHLKRQRDSLSEDKARLQAEIAILLGQTREQRDRLSVLEAEAREAETRQAALQQEVREAQEAEADQRSRADEFERLNRRLTDSLSFKEAEVARIREALDEQRQLTKHVCEAVERRAASGVDISAFEARIRQLEVEKEAVQVQLRQQLAETEDLRRSVSGAMAAAEKAMSMHACHILKMEQLRCAKLAEAINQKVELHISVPRVTLSYNNAPPLLISAAAGLGDGRIKDFLDNGVFPHFEPLWVRMDTLDKAPDGSSKRAYSTKMLERLTEAVKAFVLRSQQADAPAGSDMSLVSCGSLPASGENAIAESGGHRANTGQADAKGASRELADADRERLLQLLRSDNDQGLDSKLLQLLASSGS